MRPAQWAVKRKAAGMNGCDGEGRSCPEPIWTAWLTYGPSLARYCSMENRTDMNRPFNKLSRSVLLDVSSWPWLWKTSSILTFFGWSCWMIEPNLPLDFRCIVRSSCFQRLGFTANTANMHSPANMFTQLAPEAASPKATRRQIEIDFCSSCLSKHAYISIVFICFPLFSHIFLDWLNRKQQVGHWVSQTKMKPPANKCCYIHVMHCDARVKTLLFWKGPPQYCIWEHQRMQWTVVVFFCICATSWISINLWFIQIAFSTRWDVQALIASWPAFDHPSEYSSKQI